MGAELLSLRGYQKDLIAKTYHSLAEGNRRVLTVAPCGSGKSYMFAKMVADSRRTEVLILTHRGELLNQHKALLEALGLKNWRIGMVMTEANRLGKYKKPGLIVADEAHLSLANSWQKVIEYYNVPTVGLTATPVRLTGRPLGDVYDDLVTGITVKELIAAGRLAPYTYYAPFTVEADGINVRQGDYVLSELDKLMNDRAIYGNAVESWKKLASGGKTIAYCVSVKHAEKVAEAFNLAGIKAVAVSGNSKNREQIMQDFRNGKFTVLCNCQLISEGVSIDDVTCCLLLRPTESLALHIQQSQRCMRYMKGKQAVIIDCVGNYTRHGLPDDDREWSLTQSVSKRKQVDEVGNLTIRTCPECFMIFKTADRCPYCGAQYPLSPREIKAKEEIELARITAEEMAAVEAAKKKARQEVGRCRTVEDLWRIARERGYAPGWVYKMAKAKGIR